MAESTILTATRFREFTSTDRRYPDRKIYNAMLEAQRGLIKRRWGKSLYDKITGDIEANPTPDVPGSGLDGIYKNIVDGDGMAEDLLIALTEYGILEDQYSGGTGSGYSRGSSSPSRTLGTTAEYNAKRNSLEQKIDRYDKIMTEFIIANQADITELTEAQTIASNLPDLDPVGSSKQIFGSNRRGFNTLLNERGISIFEERKSRYNRN